MELRLNAEEKDMADSWIYIAFFLAGILVGACFGVAYVKHMESQQNKTGEVLQSSSVRQSAQTGSADTFICTGYLGDNNTVVVEVKKG